MPQNNINIIAMSVALAAIPCLSHANVSSKSGSLQMTINAEARPVSGTTFPDRPTRLILAEDRKPAEPAPTAGSQSGTLPPAPEAPAENREMERPQRASPEAANDLFQILKQAGPKQGQKPK